MESMLSHTSGALRWSLNQLCPKIPIICYPNLLVTLLHSARGLTDSPYYILNALAWSLFKYIWRTCKLTNYAFYPSLKKRMCTKNHGYGFSIHPDHPSQLVLIGYTLLVDLDVKITLHWTYVNSTRPTFKIHTRFIIQNKSNLWSIVVTYPFNIHRDFSALLWSSVIEMYKIKSEVMP